MCPAFLEPWSVWLLIGVICIGLELLMPGLVIIFFGFGAVLTAIFSLLPFVTDIFWLQIVVFLILSVLCLIFLRKKCTGIFKGTVFYPAKEAGQEFAQALEDISEKKEGRIKYKGTTWSARCESGEIAQGSTVKVLRREGISYIVSL